MADPFAWLVACLILGTGYVICIYLPIRKNAKKEIKEIEETNQNTEKTLQK